MWINKVNIKWSGLLIFLRPECPFPRIEVIFLYIQLHKDLGVHMDLRISYDDPAAILSPTWKLCSWMFRSLILFVWSPTPLNLKHIGRCCTADIELKGHSEGTDYFSLLSPSEMVACHF